MMTALGAVVYGGFFLLAALWLVVTGDYDVAGDTPGEAAADRIGEAEQSQPSGRANPVSVPAGAVGG